MAEGFLPARWNNIFSIALGVMALLYFIVVMATSVLEDKASFTGLVAIVGST